MQREVSVVIGMGGIGRAIARRVGSGTELVIADYQKAALEGVTEEMRADGYSVRAVEVDVRSATSVAAVAATASALGKLTRLVCTAGVAPVHASIQDILSVNLLGAAHVIEAFGEIIAPHGAGVLFSSKAAYFLPGNLNAEEMLALATTPAAALGNLPAVQASRFSDRPSAYGFAKHICQRRAQAGASGQWGARGARLNSISPGTIATPMGRAELIGENRALVQGLIDTSPAGRTGTADEIANVVDFLLSPAASFVTGADILADGGAIAAINCGRSFLR
ncbi:SDR family oxidoreductase [Sphingobium sp. EM0848]|uniref:SDR family oxidoreductase n=1 Tax=Sphingobium sp. EM0848 TaxID=2743473 RepID=UPI00159C97E6|nr:SDR family oxidoreductase [Sphingobium sp. EM0848]